MSEKIPPAYWDPPGLVEQLKGLPNGVDDRSFVRDTATWMQYARDLNVPAPHTGDKRLDTWVRATVAYTARKRGEKIPQWTSCPALETFWHPGPEWSYAYAIAHSPIDYKIHGIFIDRDSLESV